MVLLTVSPVRVEHNRYKLVKFALFSVFFKKRSSLRIAVSLAKFRASLSYSAYAGTHK